MNDKDILIPDGYSLVKAGQKIPKGSLYCSIRSGSRDISQWRKDNITINWTRLEHWLPSIKKNMNKKRLNTVTFAGKTYTAPAGYVFLNIGDEIKKGDSVFPMDGNQTIEDLKYTEFALSIKTKQSIYMIPSVRKIRVRKVGPAIPDGYRIIKVGEIIPKEYFYSKEGYKDISKWIKGCGACEGDKRYDDKWIMIVPIIPPVPPAPKKYNLELNESEYLALESILKKMKIVG